MKPHNFSSQIKRSISRLPSMAAILLLILLAYPTPARADTSVCGLVSGTWTPADNNYIVTCDIQVLGGTTLTIQPGVMVKFNLGTSLRVDGELIAQGATFTTNDPTPAKGDWGHIWFTTTSVDATFNANGDYVSGSKIQGSSVDWGGGVSGTIGEVEVSGASPFLDSNTIRNSSTRGIYAVGRSSSGKVNIRGNSVTNNGSGGIYVSAGYVFNNTISNNYQYYASGSDGGGIYATNSTLESNLVTNNTAARYGGGIYASGSDLTGNTVSGNIGHTNGGGIKAVGGTLQGNLVTGNNLYGTSPELVCGGGIHMAGGAMLDNTVSGNYVAGDSFYNTFTAGAGICALLSTLTNNSVTNNSASTNTNETYGGGVYSTGSSLTLNLVTGNSITGNNKAYGGGIYAEGGFVNNNTVDGNTAAAGTISRGGGIYGDLNTIQANTLTGNSSNEGGAVYSYKGTVTSNTVLTNTTSLSGTLYIDQGTATLNVLRGNSAVAGGAIYAAGATVTGNTVENNTANFGAGIYANNSTVRGNTLTSNDATSDGGGIYAEEGTVTGNSITENTAPSYGHGPGAYIVGVTDFSYNDVLTNTASGGTSGGVSISGQPVVQYNNLYGNLPYDAELVSAQGVTGTLNYWGLSACNSIPAQIYDGNDAPGRGTLAYAPSLYSPAPVAQLATPENLAHSGGENQITLDWSPIPAIPNVGCRVPGSSDPDLVYRVYYDTDSACGPYNGKGLPAGDSPITVGTNTQIALSGVPQADFVFVVTAYDYLGRESAYSNIVGNLTEEWHLFLPSIIR